MTSMANGCSYKMAVMDYRTVGGFKAKYLPMMEAPFSEWVLPANPKAF